VAHVGHAFVRREELERDRDEVANLLVATRTGRAQEGFQFGEREFDRIEVRTVRRQEPNVRAHALDGGADLGLLMGRQVVEHDHIASLQGGHEHLFDVCEEARTIDRPIKDGGRVQAVEAQSGHDSVRLPVPAGRVITEARAPRAAPVAAEEIGRDAAFIEKHVAPDIAERLPLAPPTTLNDDVGAALFVGVYGFF
jgi:hypothetical protein